MGLLFDNFESKSAVRSRKPGLKQRFEEAYRRGYEQGFEEAYRRGYEQGFKQGVEQVYARWRAWIADNPEIRELVESGKVRIPPELQSKETPDDRA